MLIHLDSVLPNSQDDLAGGRSTGRSVRYALGGASSGTAAIVMSGCIKELIFGGEWARTLRPPMTAS